MHIRSRSHPPSHVVAVQKAHAPFPAFQPAILAPGLCAQHASAPAPTDPTARVRRALFDLALLAIGVLVPIDREHGALGAVREQFATVPDDDEIRAGHADTSVSTCAKPTAPDAIM